jgi:hypothetical protein
VSARTYPSNPFIQTITSSEPAERDRPIQDLFEGLSTDDVYRSANELEIFRQDARNLYERVRASMFLHYLYRYRLQDSPDLPSGGVVPFDGFSDLMERRFEQAIASFRSSERAEGPNGTISSALYYSAGLQGYRASRPTGVPKKTCDHSTPIRR